MSQSSSNAETHIEVRDLTMAYGDFVIQQNLNFTVRRGDIFIIMGGSGCGKSTLLKVMIGLKQPAVGDVLLRRRGILGRQRRTRRRSRSAQVRHAVSGRRTCGAA